MKKLLLPISVFMAALLLLAAVAPRMTFQPQSKIWVEGTSTLHDWKMTVASFDGSIEAATSEQVGSVKVTFPVTNLKSKDKALDKKAYDALKAKANPTITYELQAADLAKAAQNGVFELQATGRLTIAGVTKPVVFTVKGEHLEEGRTRYTGSLPLKLSDFGMKRPSAMLGTIKAGNQVVVHFDVVAAN